MHSIAPDHELAPSHPSLVLAPYAERFFEGRRVAILGESTSGLAQAVAARGARHVHVYDPDSARASRAQHTQAGRNIAYAVFSEGEPGIRDGAYDVTLVPDLTAFPQIKLALARARQITSNAGLVLVATPYVEGKRGESRQSGGPLNYYDLYDALSRHFPVIKMAGQVPFQGYALVDFGARGEPSVSVDASLAEADSREPAYYLAIASERRVNIDPYAIVQLPSMPAPAGREADDGAVVGELKAKLDAQRTELDAARDARKQAETKAHEEQRRAAELSRALSEVESLPRQLERRLTEEARRAELLSAQLNKSQESLERANRELRSTQQVVSQRDALERKLREFEGQGASSAELQAVRQELETLRSEHDKLRHERETLRSEHDKLRSEHDKLRNEHDKLRNERETLRSEHDKLRNERETLRSEHDKLRNERETLRSEHDKLRHDLDRPRPEYEKLRRAHDALARAHDELLAEQTRQQETLPLLVQKTAMIELEAAALQETHALEIAGAEQQLRERARELSALKREVDRRGSLVKELLEALEAQGSPSLGPAASIERERAVHVEQELAAARGRVEALTTQLARREAEVRDAAAKAVLLQSKLEETTTRIAAAEAKADEGIAAAEAKAKEAVAAAEEARKAAAAELAQALEAARVAAEQIAAKAAEQSDAASSPAAEQSTEAEQSEGTEAAASEATDKPTEAASEQQTLLQLLSAKAEIEALRRALLQEREARLSAEASSTEEGAGFSAALLDQLEAERG